MPARWYVVTGITLALFLGMTSVNLGPLSFSIPLFLAAVTLLVMLLIGWLADRRHGTRVEPIFWQAAFACLIVGRAVFVLEYFQIYSRHLPSILDVRDGGFSLGAGLAAALAVIVWNMWRHVSSRKGVLLGVAAGAGALGVAYSVLALWYPPPPVLASVSMNTLSGERVSTRDFHGKPTVINLWATWCPPCQREMPVFEAGQINNPDIHFVFANQREADTVVQNWLSKEGLKLENVLLDEQGQLANEVSSRGLPTTLFLDSEGRLVDIRMGELSSATLHDRLNALRTSASFTGSGKD